MFPDLVSNQPGSPLHLEVVVWLLHMTRIDGIYIFITDIGFEVPDAFLVGYALDYNEYFRDLSVSLLQLITLDEKYQDRHLMKQ